MVNAELKRAFVLLISQTEDELKTEQDPSARTRNTFRLKVFKNFLKFLKKYPDEITSGDQLKGISDIGKGIRDRVDEILNRGKLKEIKHTKDTKKKENMMEIIDSLTSVLGIGEKKAQKLYEQHVKSVQDLIEKVKNKEIEVDDNIKLGLKYYDKYQKKIPRSEMDLHNKFLQKMLKKFDAHFIGTICGSYRRQKTSSNDIDFLITSKNVKTMDDASKSFAEDHYLNKFVKLLIQHDYIIESITTKFFSTKYMGFCKLNDYPLRKIDIRFVPYNSYPAALLYFTGSGDFNQKMRKRAQRNDYLLNEYGIYKIVNKKTKKLKEIPTKTERDIFDILDMTYLDPENRN